MALMIAVAAPSFAAGFGKVVAIGGQASDIVLDESRNQLYIANFGAATVQVMSTLDNTIHTSINVPPLPGSMALSLDSQYLVIAHYSNFTTSTSGNVVSVVNLANNTRQTFATGDAPLGVAFVRSGQSSTGMAMIVTTTGFVLLDPVSGQIVSLNTFANLSQQLPVTQGTFPGQILQTALTTSRDGYVVWGVGGAGTGNQVIYTYNARTGAMSITLDVSSPALLPRVSVSADGASAMIGWAQFNIHGYLTSRYPNVISSLNITGHVFDSNNGIIYGQFPDSSQPSGPAAGNVSTGTPAMLVMDADNLTVRDRITIPEDMVGRAVIDSSSSTLYAISESGVMVLPVGSLSKYPRITSGVEDVLVQTNFCNRSSVTQNLTITDPGGNHTDFTVTPSQAGVIVSPSSGVTPATIHVSVDPTAFAGTNGTTPVALNLSSASAVNQPRPVRVLMSNPDQDQRGTIVDVPGNLTDILPDPVRNRFYIIRADQNQVQVYDGGSNRQIAAFRTQTSPSMMAMTIDRNYLLVGHNDSQLVTVYDLNAMQQVASIVLPGGHYARSIAASNAAVLVLARDESTGTGVVDSLNVAGRVCHQTGDSGSLQKRGFEHRRIDGLAQWRLHPAGFPRWDRDALLRRGQLVYHIQTGFQGVIRGLRSLQLWKLCGGRQHLQLFPGAGRYAQHLRRHGIGIRLRRSGRLSGHRGVGIRTRHHSEHARPPDRVGRQPGAHGRSPSAAYVFQQPAASTGTGNSSGTGTGGNGSGSTSLYSLYAFTRTVAPMPGAGTVIVLTTSGFTVLAAKYDAAVAPPAITSVVNAANGANR